jgi:cyclophilin family peptidyl-prolyl cis-trans isomerase
MEGKVDRRLYILAGFALVAIVVVGAILISRSGGDDGDSTSASGDSTTASSGGCKEVEAPEPKKVQLDAPNEGEVVEKGDEATVVMETSCGTFEIALDTERAPKTANSFAFLAEEGFYDDTTFHRVVPGFVIQGGDPLGTGTGGPGYSVDEKPPASLSYTKGLVAMAKSSAEPPGRSGSQFYVVTSPDAGLPPEYALVGKVTEGYDAVERIEALGGPEEKPKQTVLIEQATVEKG